MRNWLMQFFRWHHLPIELQTVSREFGQLAEKMEHQLPTNPQKTRALEKLLEAKDCAVRAQLAGFYHAES